MIPYYKGKVCLNVLAGSVENAKEIYEAAKGHVVVGVLSINYPTIEEAVTGMMEYYTVLEGNLSVGLGAGNPNQWKMVGDIAKKVKAHHFNQVFTGIGYTRANTEDSSLHINALVSPSGEVGKVVISTGPLSSQAEQKAIVDIETAILMIKDMGGDSIKFFPMGGLKVKEELIAVAKACAKHQFCLEPTGGIDLENYREIMEIILDAGVEKVIPHIYSSIIDKESGNTRIDDVKKLLEMTKELVG